MSSHSVLIVDDEPDIRELLAMTIRRMGFEALCASDLESARHQLSKRHFDFCLTDMKLPDGTGLELIEHIQTQPDAPPVAVITAFGSVDLAIESMKAGAFDFLTKPIDLERLRALVKNALRSNQTAAEVAVKAEAPRVDLLGDAPPVQRLREQILKLARSQAPVYVSGESGSGKELVARLIHTHG